MTLALSIVIALQTVLLVAGGVILARSRRNPGQIPTRVEPAAPLAPPSDTPPAPPERPKATGYVRRTHYEADIAALTGRITQLEGTVELRFQQVTGLIGQLKRQDKQSSASELAALAASALEERRSAAVDAPAPALHALPIVRIPKPRTG